MDRGRTIITIALALTCGWNGGGAAAAAQVQSTGEAAQVIAHQAAVSQQAASLQFQLGTGEILGVTLEGGEVSVETISRGSRSHQVTAQYDRGGKLEAAWRKMVELAGRLNSQQMLSVVHEWRVEGLSGVDSRAFEAATSPFADLVTATVSSPIQAASGIACGAPGVQGEEETGACAAEDMTGLETLQALQALKALGQLQSLDALEGLIDLEGVESLEGLRKRLEELEAAGGLEGFESLEQAPQPVVPAVAPGDSRSLNIGSIASQVGGDLVGLLATFVALSALGFGLVFFVPRQLEIVADTVRHSFWRSFMVGLFAQPLIIPTFGMLLLGLALTVIGIVLIPFAAAAFALAIGLGITGGYLAVARSVGEAYLRQRMSRGYSVGSWLSYRYIVYGLVALLAVWLPAVLIRSLPVAGDIAVISAVVLTWMLTTAGFGATLLSHAGIRGTFTRRFDQALSDEYLYQTPQATPIVREHEHISKSRR
jgi:hypothetical protein